MYTSSKDTESFGEKLHTFSIVDRPLRTAKELYEAITNEVPLLEQVSFCETVFNVLVLT